MILLIISLLLFALGTGQPFIAVQKLNNSNHDQFPFGISDQSEIIMVGSNEERITFYINKGGRF